MVGFKAIKMKNERSSRDNEDSSGVRGNGAIILNFVSNSRPRGDMRVENFGKIKFTLRTYVVWVHTESGGDERRIERRLASSHLINHGNDAEPWLAMSTLCFNRWSISSFNEHNSISDPFGEGKIEKGVIPA